MATKSTAKQTTTAKTDKAKSGKRGTGYKGHVEGSRKEAVHRVYDQKGREAAVGEGIKLGLKESTLKSWCQFWKKQDEQTNKAA